MLGFLMNSCSNGEPGEDNSTPTPTETVIEKKPEVSTIEAINIEVSSATINAKVTDKGSASVTKRGICINTTGIPTIENGILFPEIVSKASGEFSSNLNDLQFNTKYYVRAYAINNVGVGYGNQIVFDTKPANLPVLQMGDVSVSGVHDLFVDVKIISSGDYPILESGVTWGIVTKPTIDSNKSITKLSNSTAKFRQRITDLDEFTTYYVRPFAKTIIGIEYGDQVMLSTIKAGKFTYTLNPNGADEATIKRLRDAFDEATYYYNNFTSVEKNLTVNYSPGTPTADGNISGWINMGSNQSYQRTGTAMHEIAHTIGVGTHWKWAELMKGTWQGNRTKQILRMMTDSETAQINGDGQHFWPYGINGANEDNGDEMLYIMNALILQGMKADGLPSN